MPLTKQYLTYEAECRYGVISGRKGGACLLPGARKGQFVAVCPSLEDVKLWDPRTSTVVGTLPGDQEEVCVLIARPKETGALEEAVVATGLQNGSIKIWELPKQTLTVTLRGHKSAVTCLKFNWTGTQLVSGSKDTHIVLWDLVSECGLVRLRGHKGPITDCQWLPQANILVSSSKDSLVKFWDLDTQHCFHTVVSHHREVWSLQLVGGGASEEEEEDSGVSPLLRLVTVSGDNKMRVFRLSSDAADMSTEEKVPFVAVEMGPLRTSGLEHLSVVRQDPLGRFLAGLCQSQGVEVYRVQSSDELAQTLRKRRKKAAKKQDKEVTEVELGVSDELKFVCSIKGRSKHRWVDLRQSSKEVLLVLLTLQNNSLELHSVAGSSVQLLHSIVTPGHRADVRTLSFSSDSSCILSGSAKEVKIWRRSTQQCVSTMSSRYALCSTFAPGNRFALVGTKCGRLQIFDVGSSDLVEEMEAHEGAVWGLSLTPDRRGVVTGSADKTVKFWEFELMSPSEGAQGGGKRLTVSLTRTLKLSEEVLGVCCSPSGRLLAVALLDSTMKVFFTDTLKFFLSLYGHKLPVLSMDISSDGALLVSSSADKNLRLWGLDFGDCHKSIFGHEDSITCVRFLPGTHLLFSCSKDGAIKCWDADNFQHVQTLKGHHSEVWCMAVGDDGDTLVSASHDLSLRLWQRTREPLVLSEQKELEREALMDQLTGGDASEAPVVPGEISSGEASLPYSSSKDRLAVVDRLLEGMGIWQQEQEELTERQQLCEVAGKQLAELRKHPILAAMGNIEGQRYVLNIVKGIKSSDLEECLLVMPFDQVLQFLHLSITWLEAGHEVELVCRCVCFLLRIHHHQLLSTPHLLHTISSLAGHTHKQVSHIKDLYGFNLAGLQFLQREIEGRGTKLFQDAPTLISRKRKRKYQT